MFLSHLLLPCFLLPPRRSGTLHSFSCSCFGRGGTRSGRGGAWSRLGLGLRDFNGEFRRDDSFRGQSWFHLWHFLSVTVHTDLERERQNNASMMQSWPKHELSFLCGRMEFKGQPAPVMQTSYSIQTHPLEF